MNFCIWELNSFKKCTTFHQNNDNLQVRKIYSVDLYFEGNSSVKLNTKSGKRNVCIAKLPLSDFNGTEENFYVVSIEVMYEVEGESSLFAWARICDNIQVEGYEDRVPVFFCLRFRYSFTKNWKGANLCNFGYGINPKSC